MDYKETQEQEIEALEAIYTEEEFEEEDEGPNDFSLSIVFKLPAKYPDTIPGISVNIFDEAFCDERIEQLEAKLFEVAKENEGMMMVFTIVSALLDEMETLKNEKEQAAQKLLEDAKEKVEAVQRRKFEGTVVTPETFLAWKAKFDEERRSRVEKEQREREAALAGRLTGKQLFLRDASLNLSDVALIDQSVEIDESLFDDEDLDGLDGLEGLDDSDDN